MGWKKLIMGEKMPDKNDPKYRERYENFANRWPKIFLGIVFGIVIFCFCLNVWRLSQVARNANEYQTAVEQQEQRYRHKKEPQPITNINDNTENEHLTED